MQQPPIELPSSRTRRILNWTAVASALSFYAIVVAHLNSQPNAIYGGLYSNIDGAWAEWNVRSILQFSYPFDLSPFNPFSGTGSMFLPNLPWLNPGAMVLALPLDRWTGIVLSYAVYALVLGDPSDYWAGVSGCRSG